MDLHDPNQDDLVETIFRNGTLTVVGIVCALLIIPGARSIFAAGALIWLCWLMLRGLVAPAFKPYADEWDPTTSANNTHPR